MKKKKGLDQPHSCNLMLQAQDLLAFGSNMTFCDLVQREQQLLQINTYLVLPKPSRSRLFSSAPGGDLPLTYSTPLQHPRSRRPALISGQATGNVRGSLPVPAACSLGHWMEVIDHSKPLKK